MFIWTVQDGIGLTLVVGAVLGFVGLVTYAYARYYWRKLFGSKGKRA